MNISAASLRLSESEGSGYSFPLRKMGVVLFLCTAILLFCWSVSLSEAFKLPDSGQTKCYQGIKPFGEIPCMGTGQDGEYTINPISFTDNGNGTVTDNNTGLIWQKEDDNFAYNWYQASGTSTGQKRELFGATYKPTSQNVCEALTLGGYSDWRLPTKRELMSIVDYSIVFPGPAINRTYFPNTHAAYYWTATTYVDLPPSTCAVSFLTGEIRYNPKPGVSVDNVYIIYNDKKIDKIFFFFYVRCVRGEMSPSHFVDNGNGTVTDNKTGLMWQQGERSGPTWDSALFYCKGLNLGGYTDWRLPNIKELQSLTDDARYPKYYPSVDTAFFPNTHVANFWSSTTDATHPIFAWGVHLGNGLIDKHPKTGNLASVFKFGKGYDEGDMYVRCVRSGR